MTAAAQYVNIDELRRFWAFCAIVGQFDSFPYSNPGDDYFMYADPMTQRLWFMPWGMDETFLSGDLDIVGRMWAPIAKSCMSSPDCFQAYVSQVWDVLGKVEGLDWLAEHDRVAAQIAPLIQMDTRRHYTDEEVAHGQSDMRFFVSERRMHLSTLIPPATSSP
jgi:spore coat protein CotH